MAKYFEIVIFTASQSIYADRVLDSLDPNYYISHRLFREQCTFINGIFVKDLSKLGRDLKDVIIVDNSPPGYKLHPNNGIPITTWKDDFNDRMLGKLAILLKMLSEVDDVRHYIRMLVVDDEIDYYDALKVIHIEFIQSKQDICIALTKD